jgi:putative glutamine amidotransferase
LTTPTPMNAPEMLQFARPRVLLPTCQRNLDGQIFHAAGRKYVEAVRLSGCMPLVAPATEADSIDELLELADGILLTGSPSNVHPIYFGEAVHNANLPLDLDRDRLTLGLIPRALTMGVPLLAICRGFQEVNVALGGSLHQAVHEADGYSDHREDESQSLEIRFGTLRHHITVEPGGLLDQVVGEREFRVNSLHGQGIKQLAPGLRVEARAHDGLIEAFSNPDAPAFNLGVQWHPEWMAATNPVSVKLFNAFGQACKERAARRYA